MALLPAPNDPIELLNGETVRLHRAGRIAKYPGIWAAWVTGYEDIIFIAQKPTSFLWVEVNPLLYKDIR